MNVTCPIFTLILSGADDPLLEEIISTAEFPLESLTTSVFVGVWVNEKTRVAHNKPKKRGCEQQAPFEHSTHSHTHTHTQRERERERERVRTAFV